MELPDFSSSSQEEGSFKDMMRELGLLVDVKAGAKSTPA